MSGFKKGPFVVSLSNHERVGSRQPGSAMRSLITAVVAGLGLVLAASVAAFDAYALLFNRSNHTGFPVLWLAWACAAVAAAALLLLRVGRPRRGQRRLLWAVAAIGALGAANVLAFDRLNVMSEYEVWVRKGMPEKPW
jgi:hypothetical protein